MSVIRTTLLMGALTGLLLAFGFLFAGTAGMTFALIFALIINVVSYWFSDKIVLRFYRAKPTDNKTLHSIVKKLTEEADLPMPRLYIIDTDIPNAFATG